LILEKQRAEKLQLVVDLKATEKTFHTIALKDSSQIIMLKVEDILFCKGAGDYVEVYLPDRSILHSGSLSSIVEELPSYFMKVHRSYIVNAKHIALMRRLPGGTGEIELSSGHNIPVSRRLLPKLKGAFEGC
jgi:DNA-binding LytR/AlgR family response regulator